MNPVRTRLHGEMAEAMQHEPDWHYEMDRPIPLARIRHKPQPIYPIRTDCSGFVIGMFGRVGLPDPSGNDYDGAGWTGDLLASADRITREQLQVGDGVVYQDAAGLTHHVALVYSLGPDPLLCSHGQEGGPQAIRLSAESQYHADRGRRAVYVRWVDDAPDVPRWLIKNGRGAVIGRTNTPRLYVLRHHLFSGKWAQIRFIDRRGS